MQLFFQQVVDGIGYGALVGLFAIGFGLVFDKLGILNVAQGTFATWGALIAFYAATSAGVPLWASVVLATIGAGLVAGLVDTTCFAPIRSKGKQMMIGTLITSIGVWIASLSIAQQVVGVNSTGYPESATPSWSFTVVGLRVLGTNAINFGVAVICAILVWLLLNKSGFGAAMRAIGHDVRSISIVGINPKLVILGTALLAGACAGLAGALAGISTNNISFNVGEGLLLTGFAAVVIGGMGNVIGAMVGGMVIGVVQDLSATYISSAFRDAITYGLVLVILLLRPKGLFAEKQLQRV